MHRSQIALQLYTLRDHCRTPADFAATCRRIADIGYSAVQVSAIDRTVLPENEIARICADHGLTICATHEDPHELLEQPERVVDRLQTLGCRHTAYPYPRNVDLADSAAVSAWIRQLDHAGATLAAAGLVLSYHHHHLEFRRHGRRLILEQILAETDPRNLQLELDTYWVQYGGGDPAAWCRRLRARLPLLHLKDYAINPQDQVEYAALGEGNLDFPGILTAATEAGCQWFIVEQDTCRGDPFAAVTTSFRYLHALAAP